ncbi:MAG: hypothetical protein FD124_3286 [Alphaproteobacteria bacterium]|nr:MAG: hypothetical protein FD124_3286 [Alphaproteobacteria bacterium]
MNPPTHLPVSRMRWSAFRPRRRTCRGWPGPERSSGGREQGGSSPPPSAAPLSTSFWRWNDRRGPFWPTPAAFARRRQERPAESRPRDRRGRDARAQADRGAAGGLRRHSFPAGRPRAHPLPDHPLRGRPLVRGRRGRDEGAEARARRRPRRAGVQHRRLRHVEPPPPRQPRRAGKRRQRPALVRHRRGAPCTRRPLRPVARLPPARPGRLPADRHQLRDAVQTRHRT